MMPEWATPLVLVALLGLTLALGFGWTEHLRRWREKRRLLVWLWWKRGRS